MSLLLLLRQAAVTSTRLRGRKGVRNVIWLAPAGERHDLEWWVRWLIDHWDDI